MQKDVSSQLRLLQRNPSTLDRPLNGPEIGAANQALLQSPSGIVAVGVADTQGTIEVAVRVLFTDGVDPFRRLHIVSPLLAACGPVAERDRKRTSDLRPMIQIEPTLRFADAQPVPLRQRSNGGRRFLLRSRNRIDMQDSRHGWRLRTNVRMPAA